MISNNLVIRTKAVSREIQYLVQRASAPRTNATMPVSAFRVSPLARAALEVFVEAVMVLNGAI